MSEDKAPDGVNPKWYSCCTCEYKWLTGKNGSHICTEHMVKVSSLHKPEYSDLELKLIAKYNHVAEQMMASVFETIDFKDNFEIERMVNAITAAARSNGSKAMIELRSKS